MGLRTPRFRARAGPSRPWRNTLTGRPKTVVPAKLGSTAPAIHRRPRSARRSPPPVERDRAGRRAFAPARIRSRVGTITLRSRASRFVMGRTSYVRRPHRGTPGSWDQPARRELAASANRGGEAQRVCTSPQQSVANPRRGTRRRSNEAGVASILLTGEHALEAGREPHGCWGDIMGFIVQGASSASHRPGFDRHHTTRGTRRGSFAVRLAGLAALVSLVWPVAPAHAAIRGSRSTSAIRRPICRSAVLACGPSTTSSGERRERQRWRSTSPA